MPADDLDDHGFHFGEKFHWLDDPTTPWERPALTTRNTDDHAVRSASHRLIRYANGERELYDETADPDEYRNLAADPAYADLIASLEPWMPPLP